MKAHGLRVKYWGAGLMHVYAVTRYESVIRSYWVVTPSSRERLYRLKDTHDCWSFQAGRFTIGRERAKEQIRG